MILSVSIYVFLAVTLVDIIWVFYIKYVNDSKAIKAGVFAVFTYLLGGVAIIAYTSNALYLIPASIGAYVGTVIAIKLHDYIETRKKR